MWDAFYTPPGGGQWDLIWTVAVQRHLHIVKSEPLLAGDPGFEVTSSLPD